MQKFFNLKVGFFFILKVDAQISIVLERPFCEKSQSFFLGLFIFIETSFIITKKSQFLLIFFVSIHFQRGFFINLKSISFSVETDGKKFCQVEKISFIKLKRINCCSLHNSFFSISSDSIYEVRRQALVNREFVIQLEYQLFFTM